MHLLECALDMLDLPLTHALPVRDDSAHTQSLDGGWACCRVLNGHGCWQSRGKRAHAPIEGDLLTHAIHAVKILGLEADDLAQFRQRGR